MLLPLLLSIGCSGFEAFEREEEGVWQNKLEENEGENYIEGDIIPDMNRFVTSRLHTAQYCI